MTHSISQHPSRPCRAGLGLAILAAMCCGAPLAFADSGIGVDTWRGNKLDPTGGMQSQNCDTNGNSWLSPLRRSPTGNVYNCPKEDPLVHEVGGWLYYGVIQLGYVGTGNQNYALWNRYTDWRRDDMPILGLLDLHFENPSDGSYAEVRGSRISDDDQYYQAVYGKAGSYKIEAFIRDMPNILSTDARSMWNGVGTNDLTLRPGLTPGGSTSQQVAALLSGLPNSTLSVTRKKEGLNLSTWLTPKLTVYADITNEQRNGERPYGGPFAQPWNQYGALTETVKPINDETINVNAGIRWVSTDWRFDVGYSGSFYRDAYTSYSFQQPFNLTANGLQGVTLAPGQIMAPGITQGQMSTEPDNNYHNLHAQITRVLPLNGEVSLTVSDVLMRQTDTLIAPTNCQGFLGYGTPANGTNFTLTDIGPQNPNLFNCNLWNTSAALSQTNADISQRNQLAELKASIQPAQDWTFNGGLKYYKQAYDNNYIAYNPETNLYGYIVENAVYQTTRGQTTQANAPITSTSLASLRVAPWILQYEEYNVYGGASWKISDHDTLGLVYNFDRYKPSSRERDRVDDSSFKLTWTERTLDWLTLRANYTYLHQGGDLYDAGYIAGGSTGSGTDPWLYGYGYGLPGYLANTPGAAMPTPVEAQTLSIYDVGNREENKIDLMATFSLRDDFSINASFRGDYNSYSYDGPNSGTLIGRQLYNTYSGQLSADWSPTPLSSYSAYMGADESVIKINNGTQGAQWSCTQANGSLGNKCAWSSDHERNYMAGLTALHRFQRVTFDASWNYIYSRGEVPYYVATSAQLPIATTYGMQGTAMPSTTYRVNTLTLGTTVALTNRVSLRLFDTYEIGRINDWHYYGMYGMGGSAYVINPTGAILSSTNQLGNAAYVDGGPQSYKENLIMLLLNIKL